MTADKLEAHLKICPRGNQIKEMQALPYYKIDINVMNPNSVILENLDAEFSIAKIHMMYKSMADKYQLDFPDLFHVFD